VSTNKGRDTKFPRKKISGSRRNNGVGRSKGRPGKMEATMEEEVISRDGRHSNA